MQVRALRDRYCANQIAIHKGEIREVMGLQPCGSFYTSGTKEGIGFYGYTRLQDGWEVVQEPTEELVIKLNTPHESHR